MKKILPIAFFLIAIFVYDRFEGNSAPSGDVGASDSVLATSYAEWHSGQQVQGSGVVLRLLSDDNEGSRHQRFILRLKTGQTLLVAHNIDIAPRIPSLRIGDRVAFNGEFERNEQGGVIHWTHRDPQGHHAAGWVNHDGRTYQ